jgi:hypothetical protein
MRTSTIGQKSLGISYVGFFVVLAALVCYCVFSLAPAISRKEHPPALPLLILFSAAFLWQAFTVYHHRHAFVARVLAVLYGMGIFLSALAFLY